MSEIVFGKNISDEIERALGGCSFVVTDSNVSALYGKLTRGAYVIEAGEANKNPTTLFSILGAMSERKIKRGDTVAAVGGGVVGDITGLAAALYMRGIEWVNIPTTLLAMVDSSIGGKTAVDLNGVKNLVGAFHEPRKIVIDANFLSTLPEREWKCGMGELVKTCFLDVGAYAMLKANRHVLFKHDPDTVYPLVAECAKIKDSIVKQDFKESGLRKVLNVGHTVGHALESADGYRLSHGEYVIKGMIAEFSMCRELVDGDFLSDALDVLLALSDPPTLTSTQIIDAACLDKKNSGDTISIMLPVKPGDVREVKLSREQFITKYDRAIKAGKA